MRPSTALLISATTITALSFPAILQLKSFNLRSYSQIPLGREPKMPSTPPSDTHPTSSSGLYVSDILPQTQKINIFAGLTRDIDPICARLNNPSEQSTILAPLNSAIQALARKPWEDEVEIREFGYGSKAYELGDGERRANDNLRRFVERHVVPRSPWVPGEKVQSLAGGEVWWENRDGKMVIMPQEIQVASVSGRAENGEVWVLEGVLGK